jgi:transposase
MLSLGSQSIYLYGQPADMRRSFDGLSALVAGDFPGQLLTGALFVFVNKRKNMMKVLYWHSDGLALWAKRLEKGTFRVSWNGQSELSRREFTMLLEGIVPRRMNQRFSLPDK